MRPNNIKAKSDELIQKFRNELSWIEIDYNVDLWRDTKQCAIIMVEEIIKEYSVKFPPRSGEQYYMEQQKQYWNEVLNYLKNELKFS